MSFELDVKLMAKELVRAHRAEGFDPPPLGHAGILIYSGKAADVYELHVKQELAEALLVHNVLARLDVGPQIKPTIAVPGLISRSCERAHPEPHAKSTTLIHELSKLIQKENL